MGNEINHVLQKKYFSKPHNLEVSFSNEHEKSWK